MQCAAVNTMVSEIKAAPQYCPEPVLEGRNKAANQGHAFFFEICPFTIRVWKFLIPQPEIKVKVLCMCGIKEVSIMWKMQLMFVLK